MIKVIALVALMAIMVSCGFDADPNGPAPPSPAVSAPAPPAPAVSAAATPGNSAPSDPGAARAAVTPDDSTPPAAPPPIAPTSALPPAPEDVPAPPVMMASFMPEIYAGRALIQEMVIRKGTVVRANLASTTAEVVLGTDPYRRGTDNRYLLVLKFNLRVSEYLLGSGPDSVVAVWIHRNTHDDRDESQQYLDTLVANRDTQWDDREAIVFLTRAGNVSFGTILDSQFAEPDHYFLAVGDARDDNYSLHSANYLQWLPEHSSHPGGEQTIYVTQLDADHSSNEGVVALADVKRVIATVSGELAANGGTDAQRECVLRKYEHMRHLEHWPQDRRHYSQWVPVSPSPASGQPSGTVVIARTTHSDLPLVYTLSDYTIEVDNQGLFSYEASYGDPEHLNEDGVADWVPVYENVVTARPLPAGNHTIVISEQWPIFSLCGYAFSTEWVLDTPAPREEGSVHEFFFDPIADGDVIAADADNGVLTPADFAGAGGGAASVNRLGWATSTVTLTVSPTSAMTDLVLDFIELDGSVSLTLDCADAVVDTASSTLTWSVDSQPWADGDKLMVRMRKR